MGTTTVTIGTGQDRATIALWLTNVENYSVGNVQHGIISTNDNFDEQVSMSGGTGTPSLAAYLWLDVDPANRHAGVAGTGHGRVVHGPPAQGRVIEMVDSFARVSHLEIELLGTDSSDEGIRVLDGADNVLIQYCIIHSDTITSNQDGIYIPQFGGTTILLLRVDNCYIYRWGRRGIFAQQTAEATASTFTGNVDHCGFHDTPSATRGSGIFFEQQSTTASNTLTIHNSWGSGNDDDSPFADGQTDDATTTPDGTMIWNGSHNAAAEPGDFLDIDGTDNLTNPQLATDGMAETTKTSGAWIVVKSLTVGSEDLLLLDDAAGNLAAGNGINRQGSEPDPRQDFSVDITGSARPTTQVDIGAHQVTVVAAGLPPRSYRQVYHQGRHQESQVFG